MLQASDVEPVSIVNFLTNMTTLPTELNTQLVQRLIVFYMLVEKIAIL